MVADEAGKPGKPRDECVLQERHQLCQKLFCLFFPGLVWDILSPHNWCSLLRHLFIIKSKGVSIRNNHTGLYCILMLCVGGIIA